MDLVSSISSSSLLGTHLFSQAWRRVCVTGAGVVNEEKSFVQGHQRLRVPLFDRHLEGIVRLDNMRSGASMTRSFVFRPC